MNDPLKTPQLTLGINLHDYATFDNYFIGNNQQLIANLHTMANGRGPQYLYYWGKSGVGRTHLLQACCHAATKRKLPNFYLSLNKLDKLQPHVLDKLEAMHLVCIDDIQTIAGHNKWEEAFLDLFNRLQDERKRLIIAASAAPKNLGIKLDDLVSRLASSILLPTIELTDDEKIQALTMHAKNRGFILTQNIVQFLWRRWPRDMHSLFAALNKLDQASLQAKHKLTIPFVKSVLEI